MEEGPPPLAWWFGRGTAEDGRREHMDQVHQDWTACIVRSKAVTLADTCVDAGEARLPHHRPQGPTVSARVLTVQSQSAELDV